MLWLSIKNLKCTKKTGEPCIGPVSIDASAPLQLVCGPNGSGKTILGRLLAQLSPSIFTDDLLVTCDSRFPLGSKEYRPREFSYFPQAWDLTFIGGRVRVDIDMSSSRLRLSSQHIEEGITQMGSKLLDQTNRSPFSLSRGELQRIALGILFGLQPSVAYLDEPDAFLDEEGIDRLLRTLEIHLKHRSRFFIATHRPELYAAFNAPTTYLTSHYGSQRFSDDQITELLTTNQYSSRNPSCVSQIQTKGNVLKIGPTRPLLIDHLPIVTGKMTAIFGPNSSGKSTLLRWISKACQNQPTRSHQAAGRTQTTMVSDNPDDQLGLRTLADEFRFHGIDYPVEGTIAHHALRYLGPPETHVLELSWGYKRLLTILLASLRRPTVFLIDEPEVGLDHHISKLVTNLIKDSLNSGSAVVIAVNRRATFWERANFKTHISEYNGTSILTEWKDR